MFTRTDSYNHKMKVLSLSLTSTLFHVALVGRCEGSLHTTKPMSMSTSNSAKIVSLSSKAHMSNSDELEQHIFPSSLAIRGGYQEDNADSNPPTQPQQYDSVQGNYPSSIMYADAETPVPNTEAGYQYETVQDRVEHWKEDQQQKYQNLTPEQEMDPKDDQGRLKLLASVSKGSRAFIFFIMMWRDVHLYEVADQSLKGFARVVIVVPLVLLFIANLAGVVASFSSPSHSAKTRLKAILNLDKLLEAILLFWYFIRLTVAPSKYVPREQFIANFLHSCFFIIQSQACTRLTWDEVVVRQGYSAAGADAAGSSNAFSQTYGGMPPPRQEANEPSWGR